MRTLAVCAALTFGVGCAQVQTRTHYDRWLAKNDAAPVEAAPAAPPPRASEAPTRAAPPPASASPLRSEARRAEPAPMPAGETPAIEDRPAPARRGRALRPVDNADDSEEEEVIY